MSKLNKQNICKCVSLKISINKLNAKLLNYRILHEDIITFSENDYREASPIPLEGLNFANCNTTLGGRGHWAVYYPSN